MWLEGEGDGEDEEEGESVKGARAGGSLAAAANGRP